MARMLIQTKRCIENLKKAGYKRSEFSVQSPFSKKHGGYMETKIWIKSNNERQLELIQAVAENGFDVTVWTKDEKVIFIQYSEATGDVGEVEYQEIIYGWN